METIWKFVIPLKDESKISMPKGFKILSCQKQQGEICVWARVNDKAKQVEVSFAVVGTGHPYPSDAWNYVGTVVDGDFYVWHVFYKYIER